MSLYVVLCTKYTNKICLNQNVHYMLLYNYDLFKHTSPIESMLKCDISNNNSQTSFKRLKDVTNTHKPLAGVLQCNGGKLEEAEDFKCVFVVYCVLESK